MAKPDAITHAQSRAAGAPSSGVCTSPAPYLAVQAQAGGQVGPGQAVGAGGTRGDIATAEHGGDVRAGPPDDREGEQRRRAGPEGAIGVEQGGAVEPGAGGDLGDRGLARGELQAAGAAAVDDLEHGASAAHCGPTPLAPAPTSSRADSAWSARQRERAPDGQEEHRRARRCSPGQP